jgi:hypothetical protein
LAIRPGNVVAALCERRKYPLAEGATVIDRRYSNFVAVINSFLGAQNRDEQRIRK